jgi:uncharacterized Zn finger protein (UPF0148 family)
VADEIDELAKRRKAREAAQDYQFLCGECEFGLFHLVSDGTVYCANCGAESANLEVREVTAH